MNIVEGEVSRILKRVNSVHIERFANRKVQKVYLRPADLESTIHMCQTSIIIF